MMRQIPERLDGNAAAGRLADVFAAEVTIARSTCATCGRTAVLAEYRVYMDGPGTIMRCPTCNAAVLRISHTPAGVWLDLRGAVVLHIPADTQLDVAEA